MKIELQLVPFEEKPVLKRMLELYLYDLSEFESTDPNRCGEFGYRYLDHYWTESERHPYFVKVDGKNVGFVLLNRFGYSESLDHSVAELFIMRKYRKIGVGRSAALAAFETFHGFWEIRTHEKNEPAKRFWRRTIDEYTNGAFTEFSDGLKDWKGPVWTFENKKSQTKAALTAPDTAGPKS
ncbi:GNAT family N-acetyltransferase [Pelagicoccus mobilis]|uniref:GNAT family N-acetyltransferase n=1 Tax=Pelagicoccus mobilis TaxID=415221 RepID=A0A934VJM0_9BACT|nr:GNAT family N-acetyltransferase [Pelagicoccus mobilis]MBK1875766.1 GNAT family N-acetyltransferase [Pelagicoccus mobilis]